MPEIRAAIASVHAGIEVAECRFPTSAMPPLPAVLADGAASGRYVFGDAIEADDLAAIPVTLELDGMPRRHGHGADVLGDPLAPLLWLANMLGRRGEGLLAGETISTGSATGMCPLRGAREVRARFGAANVTIAFDD